MKRRLKITKWIVRIIALIVLVTTGYFSFHFIKGLELIPPYLSEVTVCESKNKCDVEDFDQSMDNLYLHIDVAGDWKSEEVAIIGIYSLGDVEYEILQLTEEIAGDEVVVLEKDLKNGWLIGEYYIEVSIVGDNSNVIHTRFDIMAGS